MKKNKHKMYKIFLVCTDNFYYKNKIFQLDNPDNRDNSYYPYYLLQQEFLKHDVILNTYDYFNKNSNENYALLFLDTPKNINYLLKRHKNVDKFLVIYESPIIGVKNRDLKNHKYFKKIFTWEDKLIDNKKYFKLSYANKIPRYLDFDLNKKQKLCTMIIGHKLETHPLELYTERIKAIRWFEKNHPQDFDLYGMGWDRYYFHGSFLGINLLRLNRLKFLTKLLKPNYPSYKGAVKSKKETYKNYKFAICYENTSFPGYITEKIFDCFWGGCIPIYLGAQNITQHIPKNTFIDKRDFKTYDELYQYIKNMPDIEYRGYLDALKNSVANDKLYPFSVECFAKTICNGILEDLKL